MRDRQELERIYNLSTALFLERKFDDVQATLIGFIESLADITEVHKVGTPTASALYSIVIVSNAHSPEVMDMLRSVAADSEPALREVVIVDNGNGELFSAATDTFPSFTFVRPPFPIGASGGRNLGAQVCSGRYVVFIDDDGAVSQGCISALVQSLEETGATAVRGRVVPKSSGMLIPRHYDLGPLRLPALTSCEGVSAWRREDFLRFGGFDIALFGHEGIELCARMFRFCGPLAFLYEPAAILLHDPSIGQKAARKEARYIINREYINFKSPETFNLVEKFEKYKQNPKDFYIAKAGISGGVIPESDTPVSILTTAHNGLSFLEEYTHSWKQALPANSEIIYVNDNSYDGSLSVAKDLWKDDRRFIVVDISGAGRGAALNAAVANAHNDICLIADVDDISIPRRIRETVHNFNKSPDLDYLSFLLFNEEDIFRSPRKSAPIIADTGVEALFGMPVPFPAFAFRRSRFNLPFNEALDGGVDCDWFRRNIAHGVHRGLLIQNPVTYYRQHPGQITRNHNRLQKSIRRQLIRQEFARIFGDFLPIDETYIDILVDSKETTSSLRSDVLHFVLRALEANTITKVHDQGILAQTLLDAFKTIRVISDRSSLDANSRFEQLTADAERYIQVGEFKQARRTLRKALKIRKDRQVQKQLLLASKFGCIRAVARKLW